MDWSSVGYSYLEVRIFSSKTFNFIFLSISPLLPRFLWRIDTIFCLFEKVVWSPISVNWLSSPSQISSHSLLPPPWNILEIIPPPPAPRGGLNRGFTVIHVCKTNFSYTMHPCSICRLKKEKKNKFYIFEVLYLNFAGVMKKEKLVKVNHFLQISLL